MKSSWLFSDNALKKIEKLHTGFIQNRLTKAREVLGASNVKKFHPIFCDERAYSDIKLELISQIQIFNRYIDLSQKAQQCRNEIYSELKFLDWFQDNKYDVTIDSAILSEIPGCEVELRLATELIGQSCPWMIQIYELIVYEICFVKKGSERRFIGGSSDYRLLGTIFCSLKPLPYNILDLGVCLAHELGHNVLMLY